MHTNPQFTYKLVKLALKQTLDNYWTKYRTKLIFYQGNILRL